MYRVELREQVLKVVVPSVKIEHTCAQAAAFASTRESEDVSNDRLFGFETKSKQFTVHEVAKDGCGRL
jgi:hypothetical protein